MDLDMQFSRYVRVSVSGAVSDQGAGKARFPLSLELKAFRAQRDSEQFRRNCELTLAETCFGPSFQDRVNMVRVGLTSRLRQACSAKGQQKWA